MNSYYMLSDLRDNVGEGTAANWDDAELLRKMNAAQREVAFMFQNTPGDWLLKSASVTPSSSVITMPSDCSKPCYLEETSTGRVIGITTTVRERRRTRPNATTLYDGTLDAYVQGNTIVINQDSYTTGCTLWYDQRVPDLNAGTAASGTGASALVLDADNEPNGSNDYYNNVTVEVIDNSSGLVDIISTVSDYAGSTTTMTITGTAAQNDLYGTVSVLPEDCHPLIVMKATVKAMAKPGAALDPKYFEYFLTESRRVEKQIKEWAASRVRDSQYVRNVGILE